MGSTRERLLLACMVVAESAWIGVLATLLGNLLGKPQGLLTWPGVIVTLTGGAMASRLVAQGEQRRERFLAGALLGAATVYLVTAWHHGGMAWPWLLSGAGSALEATRTGITVVGAILLWWRGAALASLTAAWDTLAIGFRIGLVVMMVGAGVEAFGKRSLGVEWAAPPFVVASLIGLALAHLTEEHWVRWGRLLAMLVGSVLLVGMAAALGAATPLATVARWLLSGLGVLARWVILALVVPIAYLVEFLIRGVVSLLRWLLGGAQPTYPQPPALEFLEDLQRQAREGGGIPPAAISGMKWGLLAVLCGLALFLLGRVLWTRRRLLVAQPEGVHEAIIEEAPEDPLAFLRAHLAFRPRLRQEPAGPPLLALPQGNTPSERVVRAYFLLLNAAALAGSPRPLWQTPQEFVQPLEATFPGLPVRRLTEAFVRWRWGGYTPNAQEAQALEEAVTRGLGKSVHG